MAVTGVIFECDKIQLYNNDCMKVMKSMDDNEYDIGIVDPPYGLPRHQGSGKLKNRIVQDIGHDGWDVPPEKEYFDELFRVTKNQVIWGGNYFLDYLGKSRGVMAWDKVQPFQNFSGWEMAWSSFDSVARLFKYDNRRPGKIHPTQKPIELYEWILKNHADPNDKILDTHSGSGSSAIACYKFGVEYLGIEISDKYFEKSVKRFKRYHKAFEDHKQKTNQK